MRWETVLQASTGDWRQRILRAGAVVIAAVGLCWPTLLSGSPLWLPDSEVYFRSGWLVWQLLWHHMRFPAEQPRSVVYSFGIYMLHHGMSAWPVVTLNAVLISWTIWLVVRSLSFRWSVAVYMGLVAVLCVLTPVSWYICLLTPDILGAALVLCIYLLVFAAETQRRWERCAVSALVFWIITAHPTFPVLGGGVLCFLALLGLLRWPAMRGRWLAMGRVTVLILLGVATQVVANRVILGKATLMGENPPRMMARFLADGPAQYYLQTHCGALHWTICLWAYKPTQEPNHFLWDTHGVYQSATTKQQLDLRNEEMPLVVATLRNYPREQARRSWKNFVAELVDYGASETVYVNPWMMERLDQTVPGARSRYERAEPILNGLPQRSLQRLYVDGLPISAAVVASLLLLTWRRRHVRLLGLTAIVGFVVLANAAVTGILSVQDPRYGGRIVWLVPMLAVLMLAQLRDGEQSTE